MRGGDVSRETFTALFLDMEAKITIYHGTGFNMTDIPVDEAALNNCGHKDYTGYFLRSPGGLATVKINDSYLGVFDADFVRVYVKVEGTDSYYGMPFFYHITGIKSESRGTQRLFLKLCAFTTYMTAIESGLKGGNSRTGTVIRGHLKDDKGSTFPLDNYRVINTPEPFQFVQPLTTYYGQPTSKKYGEAKEYPACRNYGCLLALPNYYENRNNEDYMQPYNIYMIGYDMSSVPYDSDVISCYMTKSSGGVGASDALQRVSDKIQGLRSSSFTCDFKAFPSEKFFYKDAVQFSYGFNPHTYARDIDVVIPGTSISVDRFNTKLGILRSFVGTEGVYLAYQVPRYCIGQTRVDSEDRVTLIEGTAGKFIPGTQNILRVTHDGSPTEGAQITDDTSPYEGAIGAFNMAMEDIYGEDFTDMIPQQEKLKFNGVVDYFECPSSHDFLMLPRTDTMGILECDIWSDPAYSGCVHLTIIPSVNYKSMYQYMLSTPSWETPNKFITSLAGGAIQNLQTGIANEDINLSYQQKDFALTKDIVRHGGETISGLLMVGAGGEFGGAMGGNSIAGGATGLINDSVSLWEQENAPWGARQTAEREAGRNTALNAIQQKMPAQGVVSLNKPSFASHTGYGFWYTVYGPSVGDMIREVRMFDKFGYSGLQYGLESVNFKDHKYFRYIQTVDASINSALPSWLNDAVASELNRGLRLWKIAPSTYKSKTMHNVFVSQEA